MEYKFHSQIEPFRDEDVQRVYHDPNSMEFNSHPNSTEFNFIFSLLDVKIITKLKHFYFFEENHNKIFMNTKLVKVLHFPENESCN